MRRVIFICCLAALLLASAGAASYLLTRDDDSPDATGDAGLHGRDDRQTRERHHDRERRRGQPPAGAPRVVRKMRAALAAQQRILISYLDENGSLTGMIAVGKPDSVTMMTNEGVVRGPILRSGRLVVANRDGTCSPRELGAAALREAHEIPLWGPTARTLDLAPFYGLGTLGWFAPADQKAGQRELARGFGALTAKREQGAVVLRSTRTVTMTPSKDEPGRPIRLQTEIVLDPETYLPRGSESIVTTPDGGQLPSHALITYPASLPFDAADVPCQG